MKKIILYQCMTPLHMGSGTDLGFVDLPIQREKHTGFPKMEASGLKGAYRNIAERLGKVTDEKIKKLYGSGDREREAEAQAGVIQFTDGKLLLLPVKTGKGIFAWITCPYVLERFEQELEDTISKI